MDVFSRLLFGANVARDLKDLNFLRNILMSQKNLVNILQFCCLLHVLVVASVNAEIT